MDYSLIVAEWEALGVVENNDAEPLDADTGHEAAPDNL